jgi:hypothetical protein
MSKFSKYDAFQKLTSENFKRADTDRIEYELQKAKTNDELKRLSKVTANFQKQLSMFRSSKSYASTVNERKSESDCKSDEGDNTTEDIRSSLSYLPRSTRASSTPQSNSLTSSTSIQNITTEDMPDLHVTGDTNESSCENRQNSHLSSSLSNEKSPSCASTVSGNGSTLLRSNEPHTIQNKESRFDNQRYVDDRQSRDSLLGQSIYRSVDYNGKSCVVTLGDNRNLTSTSKRQEDVFVGVTYRKSARYYLSGIGNESTRAGILNFIEHKGVKVTHLMLFKPKFHRSLMTAKVNVSPEFAKTVESPRFWPDGVRCRRWMNNRDWEQKCSMQNSDEGWSSENDAY